MATSNVLFARPFVAQFAPVSTRRRNGSFAFSDTDDTSSYVSSSAEDISDCDVSLAFKFQKQQFPVRNPGGNAPRNGVSRADAGASLRPPSVSAPNKSSASASPVVSRSNPAVSRPAIIQSCNHLAAPYRQPLRDSPSFSRESPSLSRESLDFGIPWRGQGASSSSSRESSVSSRRSFNGRNFGRQPSVQRDQLEIPLKSVTPGAATGDVLQKFLDEQRRVRNKLAEMTNVCQHTPTAPEQQGSNRRRPEGSGGSISGHLSVSAHVGVSAQTAVSGRGDVSSPIVAQRHWSPVEESSESDDTASDTAPVADPTILLPATEPKLPTQNSRGGRRGSSQSHAAKSSFGVSPPELPATSDMAAPYEKSVELVDGVERHVLRRITRIQRNVHMDRQRIQSNFNKPSPLASPAGPNRLLVRKPLIPENKAVTKTESELPSLDMTPVQNGVSRQSPESARKVDLREGVFRLPSLAPINKASGPVETSRSSHVARISMASSAAPQRESFKSTSRTGRDTIQQLKELERTQKELATRQQKLEQSHAELEARQHKKDRRATGTSRHSKLLNKTSASSSNGDPSSASSSRKKKHSTTDPAPTQTQSPSPSQQLPSTALPPVSPPPASVASLKPSRRYNGSNLALIQSESGNIMRRLKSTEAQENPTVRSIRPRPTLEDRPTSAGAALRPEGRALHVSATKEKKKVGAVSPDSNEELRTLRDVASQFTGTQQTIQPPSISSSNHIFRLPDGFDPSHLQAPVLRDLCVRNIPLESILPHHEIEFVLMPSPAGTGGGSETSGGTSAHPNRVTLPGASPSDLQRKGFNLHRINSGTFCSVYKAIWRGTEVAVKCPDENLLKSDGAMMRYRALQEWRILSRTNHPCILNFHGGVILRDQLWLVTDYIKGGDLYSLLYHRPPEYLRPRIRLSLMEQLCEAVSYLHGMQPRIAHKDLKCNNLLVGSDLRLRVCDFGDAEEMNGEFLQFCTAATWQYTPPELIGTEDPARPQNATEKVDMWAVGCVFLEILRCSTPFVHILDSVIDSRQRETLRQCYLQNRLQKECRIPPGLPPRLRMLVKSCLNFDSDARPSAAEVLEVIRNSKEALLREVSAWQSRWETGKSQKGDVKALDGALNKWKDEAPSKPERTGGRFTSAESPTRGKKSVKQPTAGNGEKSSRRLLADRAPAVDNPLLATRRASRGADVASFHPSAESRVSLGGRSRNREVSDVTSETFKSTSEWQPPEHVPASRFTPVKADPVASISGFRPRFPQHAFGRFPLKEAPQTPVMDPAYMLTARGGLPARRNEAVPFGSLSGGIEPQRLLPVQSVVSERPMPLLPPRQNFLHNVSPRMTMLRNSTESRLPAAPPMSGDGVSALHRRALQSSSVNRPTWQQPVYVVPSSSYVLPPLDSSAWQRHPRPAVYPPPGT